MKMVHSLQQKHLELQRKSMLTMKDFLRGKKEFSQRKLRESINPRQNLGICSNTISKNWKNTSQSY